MSTDSKYLRIAEDLKLQIQNRQFKISEKLPSENQLVAQYGVSRQTIRSALALLREQRMIDQIQG